MPPLSNLAKRTFDVWIFCWRGFQLLGIGQGYGVRLLATIRCWQGVAELERGLILER